MGFMDRVHLNNLLGMANEIYDSDYEDEDDEDDEDEMDNQDGMNENESGMGNGQQEETGNAIYNQDVGNSPYYEDLTPEQIQNREKAGLPLLIKGDQESNKNAQKEKQWKKDKKKMELVAGLFLARPAKQFKCPRCHRPSIYFEPDLIKMAMDSAWNTVFLPRTQRWVCFNPSCPMNFVKTRTRFRMGMIGNLVPTHVFSNVVDKNPFMPI